MKLSIIVVTQIRENYGAHDWDGKGTCPVYWKSKGGEEYRHPVMLDLDEVQDRAKVGRLVKELTDAVNRQDVYFEEYVLDWYFLPEGELTSGEKQQVEWYGSVKYPVSVPHNLKQAYAA